MNKIDPTNANKVRNEFKRVVGNTFIENAQALVQAGRRDTIILAYICLCNT